MASKLPGAYAHPGGLFRKTAWFACPTIPPRLATDWTGGDALPKGLDEAKTTARALYVGHGPMAPHPWDDSRRRLAPTAPTSSALWRARWLFVAIAIATTVAGIYALFGIPLPRGVVVPRVAASWPAPGLRGSRDRTQATARAAQAAASAASDVDDSALLRALWAKSDPIRYRAQFAYWRDEAKSPAAEGGGQAVVAHRTLRPSSNPMVILRAPPAGRFRSEVAARVADPSDAGYDHRHSC